MKQLLNLLVLLPFILVYTGSVFTNINSKLSAFFKISAFIYMVIYVVVKRKTSSNLLKATLIFLPILIYGILNSFYWKAGVEDGIRYLFPVVTLFYGYTIKDKMPFLIKFVVFFVVINFLVQIVNYYYWLKGVNQWFYYSTPEGFRYYNSTAGIIRATGLVTFFGLYGFMNLISFFLILRYYFGKYKKLVLAMALFSFVASISYKTFLGFAVILLFYYYKYIIKYVFYALLVIVVILASSPKLLDKLTHDIVFRYQTYVAGGHSVRGESYRIMFNNIFEGNWFGHGVGSFGGTASTKYGSPYYKEIGFDFNDFPSRWLHLKTTDTFPPHVFVELGIIGSILFFLVILSPLFRRKVPVIVLIIYTILFIDMLFSFSLNNLEFLLYSLVFIYPIIDYESKLKLKKQ